MGMYNAIFDDELLNPLGIYKERLSQSALYAEMLTVTDAEADAVGTWLTDRGMTFQLGTDDATELTEGQLRWQYKMYIAALRIADDFGLDAVGIQYQQGLKDLVPASDLAEGLLNSTERPPVTSRDGSRVLHEGRAFPHFNEADEGVAVDALITDRVWRAMGLVPDNTLHDVRWGEEFDGEFVWVYEISGSVPGSHLGGWQNAEGWRQHPVFFPAGGSTINGISKPGEVVLSRVFIADGVLQADVFRGTVVELPADETQRRKDATNPEWPIAHVVLHDVTRDQFMARHKANHAQLVYAPDAETGEQGARRQGCDARPPGRQGQPGGCRRALRARREGGAPPENRGSAAVSALLADHPQVNRASPQIPWAPLMLPGAETTRSTYCTPVRSTSTDSGAKPGVNVRDW